jgi:hypothetical protein
MSLLRSASWCKRRGSRGRKQGGELQRGMKNPGMESVDGGEQQLWPARRTAPARVEARWGELDVDDGPTQRQSSGREGASSGARRCSGWSRLQLWKR